MACGAAAFRTFICAGGLMAAFLGGPPSSAEGMRGVGSGEEAVKPPPFRAPVVPEQPRPAVLEFKCVKSAPFPVDWPLGGAFVEMGFEPESICYAGDALPTQQEFALKCISDRFHFHVHLKREEWRVLARAEPNEDGRGHHYAFYGW